MFPPPSPSLKLTRVKISVRVRVMVRVRVRVSVIFVTCGTWEIEHHVPFDLTQARLSLSPVS